MAGCDGVHEVSGASCPAPTCAGVTRIVAPIAVRRGAILRGARQIQPNEHALVDLDFTLSFTAWQA